VTGNHFEIHGVNGGMKVSWQITGIRKDPWAKNNRIDVEEEKPKNEFGSYIHPKIHNQSEDRGIQWVRYPKINEKKRNPKVAYNKSITNQTYRTKSGV